MENVVFMTLLSGYYGYDLKHKVSDNLVEKYRTLNINSAFFRYISFKLFTFIKICIIRGLIQ